MSNWLNLGHTNLVLKDWNVVYHYTTSFSLRPTNLTEILVQFIKSGLCEVAYHPTGALCWQADGKPHLGSFNIETHRDGTRYRSAEIHFPAGLQANPYALEGAYQMLMLRFAELDLLNPTMYEGVDYVRGIVTPCVFQGAMGSATLYPQITLYENGVLNVTYRLLAPKDSLLVDEFVENYLNLAAHEMNELLIPPGLMSLDTKNYLLNSEVRDRRQALIELKRVKHLVQSHSKLEVMGAFKHTLISVNPDPANGSKATINLELLNSMFFSAVACVIYPPVQGWKFRWLGSMGRERVSWGTWIGRPNVYLFSFENQPDKATEVHRKYEWEFAKIMARNSNIPKDKAKELLGKSLRLFEDFGIFINTAINLWIYSTSGLKSRHKVDANQNELIYHLEAKAQFIDFIYASYQRLEERSFDPHATISTLSEDRRELFRIESILAKPAQSGEIKDMFDTAFRILELERTRSRIAEGASLNLERLREMRDYGRQKFEWALIVVLGISSANGLGKDFFQPLWKQFGLPLIYPEALQAPFFIAVTLAVLVAVVGILWVFAQRQRENR